MGNRILKQSICTSETIAKLSWFEEVFFYRLIVNADDYGRFEGRPGVLRSLLFPAVDNVTIKDVENAIKKLATVGLVHCYTAKSVPYVQLLTWANHQQVRARQSKFPAPESSNSEEKPKNIRNKAVDNTSDINCNQLISDENNCRPNPIQSNTNTIQSNPIAISENSQSVDNLKDGKDGLINYSFDYFWILYPKKIGKEESHKAFDELVNSGVSIDDLCESVSIYKKNCEPNYYSRPEKYLTEGFWMKHLMKGRPTCPKCHGRGYTEQNNIMYECECIHRYDALKEG